MEATIRVFATETAKPDTMIVRRPCRSVAFYIGSTEFSFNLHPPHVVTELLRQYPSATDRQALLLLQEEALKAFFRACLDGLVAGHGAIGLSFDGLTD